MHDEGGFLAAIRQTPADDTARLVFADWLDEQEDETSKTKAAFIRLELRMAEAPEKSLNRIRWTNQLQKIAARLDPTWLAVTSHPKLEACRMSFRFACPKQWARLAPTGVTNVRHCGSCERHVHFCDTLAGARACAAQGNCVALTPALVRKPNDLLPDTTSAREEVLLTRETFKHFSQLLIHLPVAGMIEPDFLLPVPPPVPLWVPEPSPERTGRPKRRREKRRPRNIQREDWQGME